jgi:hypothetical protein
MTEPGHDLPPALQSLRTRPLFVMRLAVSAIHAPGGPAGAERRLGVITGGTFEGERLSGTILDGGSDWQTIRSDGATLLDVRLVLRTTQGAQIGMSYTGIRHGPPEILDRIARGEPVDPDSYYFRTSASFATADPDHLWLNHILAIGTGHRFATGPVYSLFELL